MKIEIHNHSITALVPKRNIFYFLVVLDYIKKKKYKFNRTETIMEADNSILFEVQMLTKVDLTLVSIIKVKCRAAEVSLNLREETQIPTTSQIKTT